jgi:hypothetical protein
MAYAKQPKCDVRQGENATRRLEIPADKRNRNVDTALCSVDDIGCKQGTDVMIKTVYAIAVAAIAAACFVAFPSLSAQVHASSPMPGAKADRADMRPLGIDCGQDAWPYFKAPCLRDPRSPLIEPRTVRMVYTDRSASR